MTESTLSYPKSSVDFRSLSYLRSNKVRKPLFYIGGFNGGGIVETILIKRGWRRFIEGTNEDYYLGWTELITQINFIKLKPLSQLVNHIPNNGILTNKSGLLLSLRNYENYSKTTNTVNKLHMDDFTPKSFLIDDGNERNDFYDIFKEGDMWISKPVSANQGKGITLIRDINKFKTEMLNRNSRSTSMWNFQAKVVQRYITNPLLIEGRKFDIRCYLLIASTIPYLVMFCPGYIRLSINKYSNNDDNLITHLTNQFVQKQSPKYDSLKENTVWSIERFNEYFNNYYTHLNNFKTDWVQTDLTENIKEILFHVFRSVKYRLANSVGFFELYGFDFMVDDNLKVWLIEANSNPSMSSTCDLLKKIIPPMIEEVLFLALECFEKNTKSNKPLLPLENMKKFQIIYSENIESAKSRKINKTNYKIWTPPIYKNDIPSPKEVIISRWTGLNTVPLDISLSKSNKNEMWIDRWNKMAVARRQSVGNPSVAEARNMLFHNHIKSKFPKSLSTPRSSESTQLSGDNRRLSKSVQTDLHLIYGLNSRYLINRRDVFQTIPRTNDAAGGTFFTENKLRDKLKNIS